MTEGHTGRRALDAPSPDAAGGSGLGDLIGFLGLGNMGAPMVGRLLAAGYRVRGYDPARTAGAEPAGSVGYLRVDSAADAAAGARAVLLMLPDSAAVARALLDEGLLGSMEEGSLLIDMGSSEPQETRRLAEEAGSRGVRLLDAPVSGGVSGAREGSLTVMAGGPVEWGRRPARFWKWWAGG